MRFALDNSRIKSQEKVSSPVDSTRQQTITSEKLHTENDPHTHTKEHRQNQIHFLPPWRLEKSFNHFGDMAWQLPSFWIGHFSKKKKGGDLLGSQLQVNMFSAGFENIW